MPTRIEAYAGRQDVLFNTAGVRLPGTRSNDSAVEDWSAVMVTTIHGMFPRGCAAPGSGSQRHVQACRSGLARTLSPDGRAFNIACGRIDIGNAAVDMAAASLKGVPQADGSMRTEPVMDMGHVAQSVLSMAGLPLAATVQVMTAMATATPFIGRG